MKILYIANIRIPTEKAHGIQIMKMCEALSNASNEVTLLVPHRHNHIKESPFTYYGIKENFKIKTLPTLDLVKFGRIGFWIQTEIFSELVFLYSLFSRFDVFYSRDELPLWFLSLFKKNIVYEAHTPRFNFIIKGFKKIITISQGLKDFYIEKGINKNRIIVAPDAVDVEEFDEIIVSDGGSTDNTIEIAKRYNCKIISQNKKCKDDSGRLVDFSCARNQTLDESKYNWFVFIDSDEYFTKELVNEIRSIVEREPNKSAAYWVPRKYIIKGEVIDCATTYPNKQMRFFHKKATGRFIKKVHERICVNNKAKISSLNEYMLVPFDSDIKSLRKKWNHYIDIEQKRMGNITFLQWVKVVYIHLKISTLYIFRFFRNLLFCRGKRMPFVYELQRHVYNIQLPTRLLKNIRW